MNRTLSSLLACSAVLMAACQPAPAPKADSAGATGGMAMAPDVSIPGVKAQWEAFAGYIAKSAEMMPEADYAFKPVKTVRSFGEIIGHVAGSQKLICATALGDTPPAEDAVEKAAKTKAALIAALKESTDYCTKAYAITVAQSAEKVKLFGDDNTKFGALALNASHDGEHYGNIVTYMRIKGMVPPSSAPAMPMGDTAKKPADSTKKK